jgi:hypothetical protein
MAQPGMAQAEAGRDRPPAARRIHYVQVHYRHDEWWVTCDVYEDRREAATAASIAFRQAAKDGGDTPTQVRVIDSFKLWLEGGHDAINHAAADLCSLTHTGRATPIKRP